ncbi:hypothetical protein [Sutcliffiella horikoshii]|nr:hypothetical protein [Sutcliffiella horikoshii]
MTRKKEERSLHRRDEDLSDKKKAKEQFSSPSRRPLVTTLEGEL